MLGHRIELAPAPGTVTVRAGDAVLARSDAAIELREGRLPPRYYVPREDVRMELLHPSDTTSHCPFKGDAIYWSADGVPDVAWTYEDPLAGVAEIAGHLAFYDDRAEITIAENP